MKDTKETAQKYAYSQKAALDYLKQRISGLAPKIKAGSVFENSTKIFLKNFRLKSAHQSALDKFSEIYEIVRQISDKK